MPAPTIRLPASLALLLLLMAVLGSSCATQTTGAVVPTSTPFLTWTPYDTSTPWVFSTSTPVSEWVTYTVPVGTANGVPRPSRIDIPGVLQLARSSAPEGHSIVGWHDDQYPLPPDHPVAAEVDITLDAADVTDQTFPCRSGTRITVGPGITGYQSDNTTLTTYANCFGPPPPGDVRAFWITAGVCYELRMYGGYASASAQNFMTRYGAIWQHILASFVPPPPPAPGDTTCS